MMDTMAGQRVGEVMVSHTERIEAQCYELLSAPPLGSLLRVGSPPVYAVVREVWNEPLDPTRPLAPRGLSLETEEEIYVTNPQLGAMLTTRFAATIVGYRDGTLMRPGLPETPPNLHAFVFVCDGDETSEFSRELGWLRILLADRSPAADSALARFLRQSCAGAVDRREFLTRAGRTLAAELAGEPLRLQSVLREMVR